MADIFERIEWADQSPETPLTNARGPARWEAALEALDDVQQDFDDRITALEGAGVGAGGSLLSGTFASAPAPGVGVLYNATDLGELLKGDGTSWRDMCGGLITSEVGGGLGNGGGGGGGTVSSGPPQNFAAVGQTDNTIDLSWTAPTTGTPTSYKLYSDEEPAGVSGATAISGAATSLTVGPFSLLGVKRHWLTATKSGVESAISADASVSLPVSGGDTGGTDDTPADILNIGSGDGQNYFNEGIGYASGHVDKTMAAIIGGYSESPYFCPNAAGDAVQFSVFMNGAKTSTNTKYPRSELRELLKNGTSKAAWSIGSGKTHIMTGTTKIMHLPPNKPWVCFAQIHDADGDLVRLQYEAGKLVARIHAGNSGGTENSTDIQASHTLGTAIDWKIEVIGTAVKVYLSNVLKASGTCSSTGNYFKAGCYAQTASTAGGFESASEYARVELKSLVVTHTPALS